MDVAGDRSVGIGWGGEVYLANVRTGDVRQLTNDGHRKRGAVIYGDIVAWTDEEKGDHIFVLDLSTGEKRRITNTPGRLFGLRVSGNRLVWENRRTPRSDINVIFGATETEVFENRRSSRSDINAYDLETDEEIAVSARPGVRHLGAIDGDRIVWSDNRGDAYRGTNLGTFAYDLRTGEVLQLSDAADPSITIDGDVVAIYEGCVGAGQTYAVFLHE